MRTGELQSGLQVLDCYRTLVEVNVLHGETQGFGDATAKTV